MLISHLFTKLTMVPSPAIPRLSKIQGRSGSVKRGTRRVIIGLHRGTKGYGNGTPEHFLKTDRVYANLCILMYLWQIKSSIFSANLDKSLDSSRLIIGWQLPCFPFLACADGQTIRDKLNS